MKLAFDIDHPGERDAGIGSYTDTVIITVESGDAGGEQGEFAEHIRQSLAEWYDGAKVTRTKECWVDAKPNFTYPDCDPDLCGLPHTKQTCPHWR